VEGANIALTVTDDAGSEEIDVTIAATVGGAITAKDEGGVLTAALASLDFVGGGVTATAVGNDVTVTVPGPAAPLAHQASHQSGGSDALTGLVDATARINVSKNSGATVGTRRRLNLIEGTNITLTVADDAGNEEVDVMITGATPATITAKDEGVDLTTALTSIDFVGAGVTATGGPAITVTIPGGGAGSLTGVTALVDTGAGAAQSKTVTVTDATVSGTSKLILGWGNVLDTDANSPECDDLVFFAAPAAGSFLLRISATAVGEVVQGVYRINYLVAA
jgi:hypothetical protein